MEKIIAGVMSICMVSVIVGCMAPYTPPPVPHTYMTNTQDYHQLAGLKLNIDGSFADAIILKKHSYFVDGREVGSHMTGKSLNTLIQLPPGIHQLVYQLRDIPYAAVICTFNFKLQPNQIAEINASGSIINENGSVYSYSNFESISLVDYKLFDNGQFCRNVFRNVCQPAR